MKFNNKIKKIKQNRLARRFAIQSIKTIRKGMRGLGQEAQETKEMAQLFFRMLEDKLKLNSRSTPPTKEEVKVAFDQLKDVGRFSVFSTISIIPGGGFSLIGLELLARKLGVKNFTFVPSAFRKKENLTNRSTIKPV